MTTTKTWTSTSVLTDTRTAVLKLVRVEGAVSASRLVHRDTVRNSKRAAIKALKDLHAMGYLEPIRNCEYRLTPLGISWVDNHRALHDRHNGVVRNPDEGGPR